MKVAVPQETYPGERRVALVPANVAQLTKAGIQVHVQAGAGLEAGFTDEQYRSKGAEIISDRGRLFEADVIVQVRAYGMNPDRGRDDLKHLRSQQAVIGMCDPLGAAEHVPIVAESGATLFALELMPRITRAQSMDVLSSMATIAGYRAVLLAAIKLPKMFPLLMTAAGTLAAARVFIIGAGVAGLQAISTAKRLGGIVHAYDVRPAVRDQVKSVGARFVELPLETGQSEDRGGYAKELGEEFYTRQRELLGKIVAESDVVITTAAIPGKPSPLLITRQAVAAMAPGSVIVDLAAERGGNCELTQANQRTIEHGVLILGPTNLPAEVPNDASQMYSNNVTKFLQHIVKDGELRADWEDEIMRETCVARDGQVVHARVRQLLQLEPAPANPTAAQSTSSTTVRPNEPPDPSSGTGTESGIGP